MIRGRPKKLETVKKVSISLRMDTFKKLLWLAEISGLKKSQVIDMAIIHFYDHCQEEE